MNLEAEDLVLRCPQRGLEESSLSTGVSWSGGAYKIPNSKHQMSGF
jgi:hypothetical protein